jgi:hypothetical protein
MPGNRRVKYFHKCIVEYIDIAGVSCPGTGELSMYIRCTVKHIYVGGVSFLGSTGTNYFYKLRVRIF